LALLALLISPVETITAAGADKEEITTEAMPTVFISEIGWAGSSKSSLDEWLELANFGDREIDLSGWVIERAATGGASLTLPEGALIAPNKTYLVANYSAEHANSALASPPNYVNSGISLSNTSLRLVLKNTNQNTIDEAGDGSVPFYGGTSSNGTISMVRNWPIGNGALTDSWSAAEVSVGFDEGASDLGTPGNWEIPLLPNTNPEVAEDIKIIEDTELLIDGDEEATEDNGETLKKLDESTVIESESRQETIEEIDNEFEPSPTPPGAATPSPQVEGFDGETQLESVTDDVAPKETETVPTKEEDDNRKLISETVENSTAELAEGDKPEEGGSLQGAEEAEISPDPEVEETETTDSSSSTTVPIAVTEVVVAGYPYQTLLINEFVSDPISGEKEWVEIINPYNNVIPLTGWKISDASGKKAALPNVLLGMGQLAVAEFSSGTLNNDTDSIRLLDPTGNVIDEIVYGQGEIPTTSDPKSVARNEAGKFEITETPTKGFANTITVTVAETSEIEQTETQTTVSDSITATSTDDSVTEAQTETDSQTAETTVYEQSTLRLSELYPNTGGADSTDEFIEIENFGETAAELLGIILKDAAGGSWVFDTQRTLTAREFLVVKRTDFQFALNNSGSETVSLFAADNTLLDQIQYENAPKKFAFARDGELWRWTDIPTPNEPNKFPETVGGEDSELVQAKLDPLDSGRADQTEYVARVSIAEARSLEKNSRVIVEGIVSAAPGSLGNQIFYLTSGSAGIQIYKSDGNFPDSEVGDRIELSGTVSSSRGEPRIKITKNDAISVLENSLPLAVLETEAIGVESAGLLVRITGIVTEKSSAHYSIETELGIFDVKIKDVAGIKLTDLKPGDRVATTGIVGQTEDKLYVLPRSQDDIQKEEITETATTINSDSLTITGKAAAEKSKQTKALIIGGLTLLSLTIYAFSNRQRRNRKSYEKISQFSPAAAK